MLGFVEASGDVLSINKHTHSFIVFSSNPPPPFTSYIARIARRKGKRLRRDEMMPLHQEVATLESVKDYYGEVRARARGTSGRGGDTDKQMMSTSKDLKTSACTAAGRPHPKILEDSDRGHGEVLRLRRAAASGHRWSVPPAPAPPEAYPTAARGADVWCAAPPRIDADRSVARSLGMQACLKRLRARLPR